MIRIVTDTNVNLPADLVEQFRIELVPAYIIFGQEQLKESIDISTGEVIARLENGSGFPKTSQPTPYDLAQVYRRILEEDPAATILSIHITGAQSGTVSSARRATEEFPEARIIVFDTRSFSIGQALMVREAALMAQVGETLDAILDRLRDMRERLRTFFVLDTIDFLYKGGRIGRAGRLIGSLLNIKPVLTVRDGVMESYARFRTHSQAVDALRDLVSRAGEGVRGLRVAVGYAVRQIDARKLADDLRAILHIEDLMVIEVGAALGVYTGPGALGVAWYAPPQANHAP